MAHGIKSDLQEMQYDFPYHHLPSLSEDGVLRVHQQLTWGLDYLTYITFVRDLVEHRRPVSLIDVGCGDGRLIHVIKALVPHVCGVDLSERAIGFARAFSPDVDFVCTDIGSLSGEYACATLIEVLEHIPDGDIPGFLPHLAGLMRPDGWLIISVPSVNVPLTRKHYRHYDLELLRRTIEPCFEIEEHWWLYRRGFVERCLRTFLCNKVYCLSFSPLLAAIWRLHRRLTYYADAASGAHLICLARRRAE